LVLLSADAALDRNVHAPVNQAVFDGSAFSIFLIGQLKAIAPMYGPLARDFCLLEAGYMSQLLMTTAPFAQLGLCPIGALDFEKLRTSMALEESQIFLHCLVGGAITEDEASPLPATPKVTSTLRAVSDQLSPADGRQEITGQLQSFLREKLPDYMLPSTLVLIDSLPLTAEGKVNRQALIDSEVAQPQREIFVPPRNEMERQLAQIIQEVIEVERVGVHDNFFDLGANSLQLVQVHTRLREFLGKDIQVVDLFRYPTIDAFLKALEGSDEQQSLEQAQDRSAIRREAMRHRREQSKRSVGGHSGGENE
jgi:aryl carrier-like protein